MKLPDPVPGLVIRYSYLWHDDILKGRSEATKDRPCAIVIASAQTGLVTVVPITHAYPEPGSEAYSIEIPPDVARQIGLDGATNYVRLEVNRFEWPGPHLKPFPEEPDKVAYGMVSPAFFNEVRKRLAALVRENLLRNTRRDP